MVSWQWWHYCNCADPTTSGAGDKQAIVSDPAQPPSGANVFSDKLALIERPYPQVVAGTPQGWSFDSDAKLFQLAYSTTTPSGERLRRKAKTVIYVPKIHFPDGYRVAVQGGRATSPKDAALLVIRRGRNADTVSVTVSPG
jgi:endoglycosylceramidase